MRKWIYLIVGLSMAIQLRAQNCPVDGWMRQNYHFDARILTIREILRDETNSWQDSVRLPQSRVEYNLGLLSSVYKLINPATDSVFSVYGIHIFPDIPFSSLRIEVDTSYKWVREYLADSLVSGNTVFDSLTSKYGFSLDSYINLQDYISMTIQTGEVINVSALVEIFSQIEGIEEVVADYYVGDGDDIRLTVSADTTFLDFSYGWMDCPAGCVFRYHWTYYVIDCEPVYSGSYGNPYSVIETDKQEKGNMFPNPAADKIYIPNPEEDLLKIHIYNLKGSLVYKNVSFSGEMDISHLNTGMYILTIESEEGYESHKFFKQ